MSDYFAVVRRLAVNGLRTGDAAFSEAGTPELARNGA